MPNMESIYDYEKELGLKLLGELDQQDLSYEFNKIGVFRHAETGRLFWANTSGCSCPGDYHEFDWDGPDRNNLRELRAGTVQDFKDAVMAFPASMEERQKFLTQADDWMRS